jgi:hypothetical protein
VCLKREGGVACVRSTSTYVLDGHRAKQAAQGTRRRRQGYGLGLHQWVKGCRVRSLARSWVRGRLVGSRRGRRVRALQLFDDGSAHRARSNAANRKPTKTSERASLVRDRGRRLVARWLGKGRWLMP